MLMNRARVPAETRPVAGRRAEGKFPAGAILVNVAVRDAMTPELGFDIDAKLIGVQGPAATFRATDVRPAKSPPWVGWLPLAFQSVSLFIAP